MSGRCSWLRAVVLISTVASASGFLGAPAVAPNRAAQRSAMRLAPQHTRATPKTVLRAAAGGEGGKVLAPAGAPHVLILPGFGNAQQDYINPLSEGEERSVSYALRERGFSVYVMPLERIQWLNVLRGIFTLSFWLRRTTPYEAAYGWYVEMGREAYRQAASSGTGVLVVGHSAGGWLGRAVVGDGQWDVGGKTCGETLQGFVSLGAPHAPPPADAEGVSDMTFGALTWTDVNFPGAFLQKKGIPYVSVASDLIQGVDPKAEQEAPSPNLAAYNSYRLVCGQGAVPGDGVVPLVSAHLEGAEQLTLKCYHSISPSQDKWQQLRGSWYGSDSVLDAWLRVYFELKK